MRHHPASTHSAPPYPNRTALALLKYVGNTHTPVTPPHLCYLSPLLHMSNPSSLPPDGSAPARWRSKLRPSLTSTSSAFVFAAHAVMLDAGFTCAGTVAFEPNSAPLPLDWAQDADAYVFHYQHPRSTPPDSAFIFKVHPLPLPPLPPVFSILLH